MKLDINILQGICVKYCNLTNDVVYGSCSSKNKEELKCLTYTIGYICSLCDLSFSKSNVNEISCSFSDRGKILASYTTNKKYSEKSVLEKLFKNGFIMKKPLVISKDRPENFKNIKSYTFIYKGLDKLKCYEEDGIEVSLGMFDKNEVDCFRYLCSQNGYDSYLIATYEKGYRKRKWVLTSIKY